MTTRLRSVLFLLVASLVAVALSACGGDGEAASADTDVNQLLKETFTGDKKVESGKLDLKVAIAGQGGQLGNGPIDLKLSGPFQTQGENKVPKVDMDVAFSGAGQTVKGGLTSTGDRGFVNFNGQEYAVAAPLFKQIEAGLQEAQKQSEKQSGGKQPSLASLGIDPRKWLTNATNAGEAKVGDADTIRITGGVDVAKFLDDVNAALKKGSQLGLQNAGELPQELTPEQRKQLTDGIKGLKVEMFTGAEDKILRRMVVDLDAAVAAKGETPAQSAKVKLDFSLLELNEDQEIEAPANAKPLDQLLQQFGGAGALGGAGAAPGAAPGATPGAGAADQEALKKYTDCITAAGSDSAKAQECGALLTP